MAGELDSRVLKEGNQLEPEELERLIAVVAKEQKPSRVHVLTEIFKAAVKLAKESPGTLNLKITANVLKELRYSFKMFYPHRFTAKITIFGSARIAPDTPVYQLTKEFAAEATKRNYMIITGGGPGVMAAGNEGATGKSFGLNIRLPMEQVPNRFIDSQKMLINYKYFFTRKLFLVKEASAFVFFPGGFGTFDEAFEVLTLLQTGKTSMIPVVLLEPKNFDFWKNFMKFLDQELMRREFIGESDKHLFHVYNTPQQALDHIDLFYSTYHSMRFVKDKVVIRLKRSLTRPVMGKIHKEFSYLSMNGKFELSAPLQEESNEPELHHFARLVFPFERRDFGGLRSLIDFINEGAV